MSSYLRKEAERIELACQRYGSRLRDQIEDRRERLIYHYTSAEGFHNIISNKQLFFTDVAFLNDSTETVNIITTFRKSLEVEGEKIDPRFLGVLCELFERNDFDNMIFGSGEERDFSRHFVLACSYQKDSLNMWNYYTKGNETDGGYNIAFGQRELIESLDAQNSPYYGSDMELSCGRVIYREDEKVRLISDYLVSMNEVWSTASDPEDRVRLLSCIKSTIEWLSIFYKHECFAMEEEYRIVISLPNSRLTEYFAERELSRERLYKIRFRNNMFTPYVKLKFEPEGVKGVCMSPLCEKYTTEYRLRSEFENQANEPDMRDVLQYGVHEFLRINGYRLDWGKVQRSAIPLRF